MIRLNIVLLLAVIISALYVVHTQYVSRQLFTSIYRAQAEGRRLQTEADQLEVQKRAQATPLRIEALAREQLNMRSSTPSITLYVRPNGAVLPAALTLTPVAVRTARTARRAPSHAAAASRKKAHATRGAR
ncbi:MAG: cell division protein FtsL [Burkholderiaceae bacterium]|nr:cell division protein FtsL [Burkholderiaceae bacterium]